VSDAHFRSLAREAAAAYPPRERFARHFAYGKLRGDPAFAHLLRAGRIPARSRLLDIGCGQGLLCALLAAAEARHARGEWDAAWPAPPALARYTGIDLMSRDVERARAMAEHWGAGEQPARNFVVGDMRDTELPRSDVVVILDVLHYVGYEAQEAVLGRVKAALMPRGTLLLRVGDESTSMSFRYTLLIDRLVMAARGHKLPRLWCRPVADWRKQLERMGFDVETVPMSTGTLFANVLLVARYDEAR
jgi:2-polyprenyl-3-methyl-5-hydroxy-6-metoxy-1,4-benzoquinol methylase